MGSLKTMQKTVFCLFLIGLVCLSHKAQADTFCMRTCPSECVRRTGAEEIHCYFHCIINCKNCPDSPIGCSAEGQGTNSDVLRKNGVPPEMDDKLRGLQKQLASPPSKDQGITADQQKHAVPTGMEDKLRGGVQKELA